MDLSGPRFSHLQDKTRCKQLQHVKVRKASPTSQGFHKGGSRGQTHPPTSHSGEQQKHTHTHATFGTSLRPWELKLGREAIPEWVAPASLLKTSRPQHKETKGHWLSHRWVGEMEEFQKGQGGQGFQARASESRAAGVTGYRLTAELKTSTKYHRSRPVWRLPQAEWNKSQNSQQLGVVYVPLLKNICKLPGHQVKSSELCKFWGLKREP